MLFLLAAAALAAAPSTAWFEEARFGLFVHWSPSALWAVEIMEPMRSGMPPEEYRRRALTFDPQRFDPRAWVALAKEAGARYVVFTAKHHDGFAMWDTKVSDLKITNAPLGRDVVAELARACAEAGMPLGLYYSMV